MKTGHQRPIVLSSINKRLKKNHPMFCLPHCDLHLERGGRLCNSPTKPSLSYPISPLVQPISLQPSPSHPQSSPSHPTPSHPISPSAQSVSPSPQPISPQPSPSHPSPASYPFHPPPPQHAIDPTYPSSKCIYLSGPSILCLTQDSVPTASAFPQLSADWCWPNGSGLGPAHATGQRARACVGTVHHHQSTHHPPRTKVLLGSGQSCSELWPGARRALTNTNTLTQH